MTTHNLVVPLRPCKPWCDEGDGHPRAHPVDRSCWSEYQVLPMSQHDAINMGNGEWWTASLNAYLRRRGAETETLVYIHSEETDNELRLTVDEARDLRDILDTLIEKAEDAEKAAAQETGT